MATLRSVTPWSITSGATATVTIPATAAGSTLIVTGGGGALITAKITNVLGATFTKRTTYGGGSWDVSIQDFVAVGGETAVFITLNGPSMIAGHIYEVAGLGAFVSQASNSGGDSVSVGNDWQMFPPASSSLASGAGLLVSAYAILNGANNTGRAYGLGPYGRLDRFSAITGVADDLRGASGLSDITAAKSYPENLAVGTYRATSASINANTVFAAQAIYADSSGTLTVPAASNPIVAENSLPGRARQNWHVGGSGTDSTIAGFTDKTSYSAGDTVNFKVDSANTFRVEIYRLGWYNSDPFGARNVLGYQTYLTGTPTTQPSPSVDGTLGSPSCAAWTTNATWAIPADACPGRYFVLFRRTDAGNTTKFASGHFIIKGSATNKVAYVASDFTTQAYNPWGATTDSGSTYTGRSYYELGVDANLAHRGYAVSFDRPYATQTTRSQTDILDAEQPMIVFLEAQGYDLTYLSMHDLDANTTLLNDAKLIFISGHNEYWTTNAYDCVTSALDAGVNMVVQSSNTALWRVRFDPGDTARRTMICYKDSLSVDGTAGFTGTGRDPGGYTGTWRDARTGVAPNNPDVRRENATTGQLFFINGNILNFMTVPFAFKGSPIWRNSATVQALTTGNSFTTVQGTIGGEGDWPDGSGGQPANLVSLSSTPLTGLGNVGSNANGSIYASPTSSYVHQLTLYRRDSGALIYNTGSWRASFGLCRYQQSSYSDARTPDVDWQNAWLSVLFDLGLTPTTLTAMSPAVDTALTDPATGAPGPTRNDVARAYGLTVADTVDGAGTASFSFSAGGVGHVLSRGIGAASASYSAAGAGHSVTRAIGSASFMFSASGIGTVTSSGVSRNVTVTITLAPGTPHEVHTSLGGREYVGLTLTSDLNISTDAIQLSLGSWTTPGTWVTPTLDDHGTLSRTVAVLVGGDIHPTVGEYYLWMKMPDTPEIVIERYETETVIVS